MIGLHLNESPFNLNKVILDSYKKKLNTTAFNRYGSFWGEPLINKLSEYHGIPSENFFVGNGTDSLLKMLTSLYLDKGDKAITLAPFFICYPDYVKMAKGEFLTYSLNDDGSLDEDGYLEFIKEHNPKIVYLCNPHNPTGMTLSKDFINRVIDLVDGMVIVDEAYIELSNAQSFLKDAISNDKVICTRTFSKGFGIAGVRLGYFTATTKTLKHIKDNSLLFSLGVTTEALGVTLLEHMDILKENIAFVKGERERMEGELSKISSVTLYPSQGSFYAIRVPFDLESALKEKEIFVSKFPWGDEFYRITVGSVEANNMVLDTIRDLHSKL